MRVSIELVEDRNLRIHTIEGDVDVGALLVGLRSLYSADGNSSRMNSIWDLRKTNFPEVDPDAVRTMMKMVSAHWGRSGRNRSALVVAKDLDYGITKMYEIMMNVFAASDIMFFRDYDDAINWIDSKEVNRVVRS